MHNSHVTATTVLLLRLAWKRAHFWASAAILHEMPVSIQFINVSVWHSASDSTVPTDTVFNYHFLTFLFKN